MFALLVRFTHREGPMAEGTDAFVAEHDQIERRLPIRRPTPTPCWHGASGRRYAELARSSPPCRSTPAWSATSLRLPRSSQARTGPSSQEAVSLAAELNASTEKLTRLLAPRDPNDGSDAILEVKAGEGGEESALFAGDLLRMYTRYAEQRGWKVEVLDSQETDLGGYKSITMTVKAPVDREPRCDAVRGPEVRGRRAPRAARARHRVAGPHPHLRRRRPRDARGRRPGRGRDRPERPADRRLPVVRTRRPEREHHRLGRPDHPPAHRHRGLLPERALAAAEQGVRDADAARPPH